MAAETASEGFHPELFHPLSRATIELKELPCAQQSADRYETEPIPKYSIPSKGVPPHVAYDLVNSELALDGKPL